MRGAALGGAGLAAAALIGCGDDDDDDDDAAATATAAADATVAANVAGEANFTTVIPWSGTPKTGGEYVLTIGPQIGSFDTTKSGAIGNLRHAGTTQESLLAWRLTHDQADVNQRDLNRDVGASLAESWKVSPDGLTFTFNIKAGVKWHNISPLDGRPSVADDVRFAYERYADTGVWQGLFTAVSDWEVPDDLTLTTTLGWPSPDFIVPLSEQNTGIFARELVDNGTLDTTLSGTGPFMMEGYEQSEFAKYVRNPDWHGPEPYLDTVE